MPATAICERNVMHVRCRGMRGGSRLRPHSPLTLVRNSFKQLTSHGDCLRLRCILITHAFIRVLSTDAYVPWRRACSGITLHRLQRPPPASCCAHKDQCICPNTGENEGNTGVMQLLGMCFERWGGGDGVQCEHVGPLVLTRQAALDEVLGLLRHLQKHVTHFTHDRGRTVSNKRGRSDECGYRQNMDMEERPWDSQETSSQRLRRAALCPPAARSKRYVRGMLQPTPCTHLQHLLLAHAIAKRLHS